MLLTISVITFTRLTFSKVLVPSNTNAVDQNQQSQQFLHNDFTLTKSKVDNSFDDDDNIDENNDFVIVDNEEVVASISLDGQVQTSRKDQPKSRRSKSESRKSSDGQRMVGKRNLSSQKVKKQETVGSVEQSVLEDMNENRTQNSVNCILNIREHDLNHSRNNHNPKHKSSLSSLEVIDNKDKNSLDNSNIANSRFKSKHKRKEIKQNNNMNKKKDQKIPLTDQPTKQDSTKKMSLTDQHAQYSPNLERDNIEKSSGNKIMNRKKGTKIPKRVNRRLLQDDEGTSITCSMANNGGEADDNGGDNDNSNQGVKKKTEVKNGLNGKKKNTFVNESLKKTEVGSEKLSDNFDDTDPVSQNVELDYPTHYDVVSECEVDGRAVNPASSVDTDLACNTNPSQKKNHKEHTKGNKTDNIKKIRSLKDKKAKGKYVVSDDGGVKDGVYVENVIDAESSGSNILKPVGEEEVEENFVLGSLQGHENEMLSSKYNSKTKNKTIRSKKKHENKQQNVEILRKESQSTQSNKRKRRQAQPIQYPTSEKQKKSESSSAQMSTSVYEISVNEGGLLQINDRNHVKRKCTKNLADNSISGAAAEGSPLRTANKKSGLSRPSGYLVNNSIHTKKSPIESTNKNLDKLLKSARKNRADYSVSTKEGSPSRTKTRKSSMVNASYNVADNSIATTDGSASELTNRKSKSKLSFEKNLVNSSRKSRKSFYQEVELPEEGGNMIALYLYYLFWKHVYSNLN